ncbi:uncharacterized protein LOC143266930 isoform X2 [Peromyscus maniculatus bairdii]|uniref:uncharacterized protein LOC143266930 isoform X2 n=1 Tax=Peromyscus maniculatus bairdii TaxID=230844 RepID=UPI003FD592C5
MSSKASWGLLQQVTQYLADLASSRDSRLQDVFRSQLGSTRHRQDGVGGCDCAGPLLPSSQELGRSCDLAGGNLSQEATSPPEGKEDVPSNSVWRTPWRMGPLASGRLRTLVRGMLVPWRVLALPDPEVTSG